MLGYNYGTECVIEFMNEGQIGLSHFIMIAELRELKQTMSFDAKMLNVIGTHKFEYTQRQDIHEHQDMPQKRGFFRRR